MPFEQLSATAQVAAHELGVAIPPSCRADGEIEARRLIPAFGEPVRASGDCYLVWSDTQPERPPLEKLINWTCSVVRAAAARRP